MAAPRLLPALALAACNADPALLDVAMDVSPDVVTVARVTWSTDVPTSGHVEFAADGEPPRQTPEDALATDHEALLLGLPASTAFSAEVVATDAEGREVREALTGQTGDLPNTLPTLVRTGEGHDRFSAVPLLSSAGDAAVILDPEGRIVWYHEDTRGLDVYRTRLSVDGRSVLYNAARVSGEPAEDAALVRVSLDGSEVTEVPVPSLTHDFVEHADGTLAAIAAEIRTGPDGEDIRGDRIVEVGPDGTPTEVWSAWDCFDPAETPGDDPFMGWTFANALDWDEDADQYTLSLRNFSSIVRVDPATRTCPWAFGGAGATFRPDAGSASFLHEHQFEILPDGLLVFDNEGAPGASSRVLEYDFDPAAGRATERWAWERTPPVYTFVLGDVARLDNGDTLVDFAVGGAIDRVTPAGDVTWSVATEIGWAFGFLVPLTDLYPTSP